MGKTQNDDEVPIRAVSRAFQILQVINRRGNPTIMEIKDEVGLPYPTVYRMMMTLVHEGLIECETARKRYRPTELVWTLVAGYQPPDNVAKVARPILTRLTTELLWPVALSVRVGNRMMVKDSTHAMTTQTFVNYYPGYTLPLTDCASGHAYFAFCSDEEQDLIRRALEQLSGPSTDWGPTMLNNEFFVRKIRADGYATYARNVHNETPGKTSSISVPVLIDGVARSCLTLIFFERAMPIGGAVERYAVPLKNAAEEIAAAVIR